MGLYTPTVTKKWWDIFRLQLTPDNSNLLGKSKKVRVIGSLKPANNRYWGGNAISGQQSIQGWTQTPIFSSKSSARDKNKNRGRFIDRQRKGLNNVCVQARMDTAFELEWQNSKDKDLTRLSSAKFNISDFSTRCFFSRLFTRLKHGSSYRG